jgi:hypothetical protein
MNLSDKTKEQLISAVKTFAVAFIVTSAAILTSADSISWTFAFWGAVATAGLRAGITALIAPYIPVNLGGKKK